MYDSLRCSLDDRVRAQRAAVAPLPLAHIGAKWLSLRRISRTILALLCVAGGTATPLYSTPQLEGQTWKLGDYIAYASAVRTDFLAPQVADKLNIERSNDKALITVSVQKPGRPTASNSVEAEVRVTATRSEDATENVEMHEYRTDNDIYYLGVLPIRDRKPVSFDFAIIPTPGDETYRFGFERFFFTD